MTSNLIGKVLSKRYYLDSRLDAGGMGEIYRGVDLELERYVAVKTLPTTHPEEAEYIQRFEREAAISTTLEHAHIVPVYHHEVENGIPYIVMRLLKGGSLAGYLRAVNEGRKSLPTLPEVGIFLVKLADALQYAHGKHVIHRDIKPSNIMFDEAGNPVLVDFGIAKMLDAAAITTSGTQIGTPVYMAPEQSLGKHTSPAIDQYALAVLSFELLTGQWPFQGNREHIQLHHINTPPPMVHTFRKGIPEAVSYVLLKALSKNPIERFANVKEFAEAFQSVVQESSAYRRQASSDFFTVKEVFFNAEPVYNKTARDAMAAIKRRKTKTNPPSTKNLPKKSQPSPSRQIMGIFAVLSVVLVGIFGFLLLIKANLFDKSSSQVAFNRATPTVTLIFTETPPSLPTATEVLPTPSASPTFEPTATSSMTPSPSLSPTLTPLTATLGITATLTLSVLKTEMLYFDLVCPDDLQSLSLSDTAAATQIMACADSAAHAEAIFQNPHTADAFGIVAYMVGAIWLDEEQLTGASLSTVAAALLPSGATVDAVQNSNLADKTAVTVFFSHAQTHHIGAVTVLQVSENPANYVLIQSQSADVEWFNQQAAFEKALVSLSLSDTPPVPEATPEDAYVLVENNVVNLRRGPGIDYGIVGSARIGERLTILAQIRRYGETWYLVRYGTSSVWVAGHVVTVAGDQAAIALAATIPPTYRPRATATLTPEPYQAPPAQDNPPPNTSKHTPHFQVTIRPTLGR